MTFLKKSLRAIMGIILIAFVGGVGFFAIDRYLVPILARSALFSKSSFLKSAAENTTIINKTEQIVIREDDSVEKISSQAATAVVNILSLEEPKAGVKQVFGQPLVSKSGSGVLVTNDGMIITYRKAILESAKYTVFLYNGSSYEAKLIGIDDLTNLAYLKIEASNVPAISFSNSDDMRPGKKLVALANTSEAYQNRFATALLSDIDKTFNLSEKTVASSEKWEGVFRMDFSNQAEYLGSPVINFNGELVGLMGSADLDNQTRYFLLPANIVRESLDLAIRGELDKRPTLGVYYLSLTKELNAMYHLGKDQGAWVFSPSGKSSLAVIAGSSAEKAGLEVNDIILAVNGQLIDLNHPLSDTVGRLKKGEKAEFTLLRRGEEKKIMVQL